MPRDTEAKRQVILVAIEKAVEGVRQEVRDAHPEIIANIYRKLDADLLTMDGLQLTMPEGRDLL